MEKYILIGILFVIALQLGILLNIKTHDEKTFDTCYQGLYKVVEDYGKDEDVEGE